MLTCSACDGPLAYLGTLGNLDHLRCINCGMQYSRPHTDEAGAADEESAELQSDPLDSITLAQFRADDVLPRLYDYLSYTGDFNLTITTDPDGDQEFWIFDGWRDVNAFSDWFVEQSAFEPMIAAVVEFHQLREDKGEYDAKIVDLIIPDMWAFGDEYTTCGNCNRAIRTSPESYAWQADYWLADGEILCRTCTQDRADEYIDWASWANRLVNTNVVNPSEYRFHPVDLTFENGLHRGQNDDPINILRAIRPLKDRIDVVFTGTPSQFDIAFQLWARFSESYHDDCETDGTPIEDSIAADQVLSLLQSTYHTPTIGPSDHVIAALKGLRTI